MSSIETLDTAGEAPRKVSKKRAPVTLDRHALYEAAVQCVEADVDFLERTFRRRAGRRPVVVREDFCGTGALACEFAGRRRRNRAIGVDLDSATLDWGRRHRVAAIGDARSRVELHERDVRAADDLRADVVIATNFSYFTFHRRADLGAYFASVRRSLHDPGVLVLDVYGGTDASEDARERRRKPSVVQVDGRRVPAFTYVWEQSDFNPVDHTLRCSIGFEVSKEAYRAAGKPDGWTKKGKSGAKRVLKRAFTYDWRMWTVPELHDLLGEAGFEEVDVYVEGWDDALDEGDGVFRRRARFENQSSWIAYVVAYA